MLKAAVPEIHVTSSKLAKEFYSKLGFACVSSWRPDETHDDPCYMTFVRDGVRLNVSSFRDGSFGTSVYVFVDDVDALHAEFVRNRVPNLSPLGDQTWGMREFGVLDSDRNNHRFGQRSASSPSK